MALGTCEWGIVVTHPSDSRRCRRPARAVLLLERSRQALRLCSHHLVAYDELTRDVRKHPPQAP